VTPPDDADFARVDQMLGEVMMHHFELGGMVGEYRTMVSDLQDRQDRETLNLARGLPGARYFVQIEHIRQTWLKIEVELRRMFPKDD
jgi:hypothetical protein